MRSFVSVFFLALLAGPAAPVAFAQNASTCIALSNSWYTPAKDKTVSVEIDGYPNSFWTARYDEMIGTLVTDGGQLVRGATFSIRAYDGNLGSRGGALIGTSTTGQSGTPHIMWTFAAAGQSVANSRPECASSGIWLLYIYN